MTYGTICSGINAPGEAWNSMGWTEQFCAEIESYPCSVLKQRHPSVPNLGDITKYEEWPDFGIDLLCGGTPCQSFSLAGLRKGMDDPRGQLTRAFIGIAAKYRPRWVLWENVPGVFSADGGEAFAGFLAGLTGRKVSVPAEGWGNFGMVAGIRDAYGVAWRVFDTQFVTVDTHPRACPQLRERVFVVGHIGGCWQRAAAVLLERESLCGNPAPRRTQGKGTSASIAPSLTGSSRGVPRPGDSRGQDPVVAVSHALTGVESDASEDGTGRGTPIVPIAFAHQQGGNMPMHLSDSGAGLTIQANQTQAICFDSTQITSKANRSHPKQGDPCHPLAEGAHPPAIAIQDARGIEKAQNGMGINTDGAAYTVDTHATQGVLTLAIRGRDGEQSLETRSDGTANTILTPNGGRGGIGVGAIQTGTAVRRLTPRECARLQGFRDDYLDVTHNGKPAADGPKYRALGNAMSVNVMRFLGQRIQMVDEIPTP